MSRWIDFRTIQASKEAWISPFDRPFLYFLTRQRFAHSSMKHFMSVGRLMWISIIALTDLRKYSVWRMHSGMGSMFCCTRTARKESLQVYLNRACGSKKNNAISQRYAFAYYCKSYRHPLQSSGNTWTPSLTDIQFKSPKTFPGIFRR